MKKILLIIILIIPLYVISQENKENKPSVKEIEQKLEKIQETIDRERYISDKSFNSISNQLSASSNSLSLFGILFGVLAIAIGIYVTYIERKIVALNEKNIKLLNDTKLVKEEVVEINRLIQQDIEGLYKKIKKEETSHILDRLIKVPYDISNLMQDLLSRELDKVDFDKLKISFHKINPKEKDYVHKYQILFFQHFADLALKDENINPIFTENIASAVNCSFENDIMKSTNDIFSYLIDDGFVNNKLQINEYFKGLNRSEFKEYKPLYDLIIQKISHRDKLFLLCQLIESKVETQISKTYLGDIIQEKYGKLELTESEKTVIEDLKNLKLQKEEREEKLRKEEEERVAFLQKQKEEKEERIRKQKEANDSKNK
jgi:hypothetical protein